MSEQRSNDPFEHFRTMHPTRHGSVPSFDVLNPLEVSQCKRLGVRAAALVAKHAQENPQRLIVTPHPIICAMDFAVVHLARPLKLQALEDCDDLAFMADFIKIAQHIDRDNGRWNRAIPLQFYDTGLRAILHHVKLPWR